MVRIGLAGWHHTLTIEEARSLAEGLEKILGHIDEVDSLKSTLVARVWDNDDFAPVQRSDAVMSALRRALAHGDLIEVDVGGVYTVSISRSEDSEYRNLVCTYVWSEKRGMIRLSRCHVSGLHAEMFADQTCGLVGTNCDSKRYVCFLGYPEGVTRIRIRDPVPDWETLYEDDRVGKEAEDDVDESA